MDSKSPPRIHPCVCGFTCDKYSLMKHHREACAEWQNRPNPMRMMIERRRATTNVERSPDAPKVELCEICHHRPDHHDSACPNSQAEKVRRQLIAKHGIDPIAFQVFLRLLAKRYAPYTEEK